MLRTTVLATATVLTFTLSACSGGDSEPARKKLPPLTTPQAGQCIAKEVKDGADVAPDTESVVPCDQNHGYEIVATVPIPAKLLAGTTNKEKLAHRAELAATEGKPSKARQQLIRTVYAKCAPHWRKAAGLDKLTVLGKSAKKVKMGLSGNFGQWTNVSSPELWLRGKALAICSIRYEQDPTSKGISPLELVRSTSTKPAIASYLTKDFPLTARGCSETNGESAADCALPHDQERLFTIDMKAVYGKKFLSGADLTNVSADELVKIRAACNDPYEQVGGKISEATPMGFRFFNDISTTGSYLPIICTLKSADGEPLGSTFTAF